MEDALEEVVGEIYDEHDEAEGALYQKIADDKYVISPDLEIEKLFEILKIEHLPDTNYSSVGGLIYELSESLPKEGTEVSLSVKDEVLNEHNDYVTTTSLLTFRVDEMKDDRIEKLTVTVSKEKVVSDE